MAQERKKRRIVLTSILKPVDDTRMFEKMGASLAQSGGCEVFILAYPSGAIPSGEVHCIPSAPFKRLSFARWSAKWVVFRRLLKLKPDIVIFNTHELLLPCILLKVLVEVKIVYDVRENYYRNILHSESFPWLVRVPLALLVRFKEKLLAPAVDHFFLAEKGYEDEFRFHRGGWTVIENKAMVSGAGETRKREPGKIRLLFSGTLAESTGVFRAIDLARELHRLDSMVRLTIAGYASLKKVTAQIQEEVRMNPWITLIGGGQLVPHQKIVECIYQSDFGIIAYPLSEHTKNSKPTKLFEYLSAQLPIIVEEVWPWIPEYAECQPFLFCDYANPDGHALLEKMKMKSFYSCVPEDVTWGSEASMMLRVLEKI